MDVVLRSRHDLLASEFICAATELRIVRTPPGSLFTRTIDAFCGDERASRYASLLSDFVSCCASCSFLARPADGNDDSLPLEDAALEQP